MRFTVDAIAGLAFGTDVNTLQSDDDLIQRHLDKIFPKLFTRMITALLYWRFFKLPSDRELDRALAAVNGAIDGFIRAARQRLADEPALRSAPQYLLQAMVAAADEPGSGIDDAQVAGNVMTMLLAGEDHRQHAGLVHLAAAPASAGAGTRHGRGARRHGRRGSGDAGAPGAAELRGGLHARDHAPEAGGAAAAAAGAEGHLVGDVAVPAGTVVISLMRHDSVDNMHVPEAQAFRPERWLGEDGLSAGSAKRISMPFGAGPRICPGPHLALQEMKMVLLTLHNHFDIQSVGTADGSEPAERLMFAMAPVGLRMRLTQRHA